MILAAVIMPLEFIDSNTPIDRATRRRIRSHAATGKNAGKTLVRPSRKKLRIEIRNNTSLDGNIEVQEDSLDSEKNKDVVHEIERQIGNGLSVFSIQMELNPRSAGLVKRDMCGQLEAEVSITPPAMDVDNRLLPSSFLHQRLSIQPGAKQCP